MGGEGFSTTKSSVNIFNLKHNSRREHDYDCAHRSSKASIASLPLSLCRGPIKKLRMTSGDESSSSIVALATEGSWSAYLDEETTGLVYYFNAETGESLWDPPTSTFPKVRLNRKKRVAMMDKRKEYNQNALKEREAAEQQDSNKKSGFLSGFMMDIMNGSTNDDNAKDPQSLVTNGAGAGVSTEEPILESSSSSQISTQSADTSSKSSKNESKSKKSVKSSEKSSTAAADGGGGIFGNIFASSPSKAIKSKSDIIDDGNNNNLNSPSSAPALGEDEELEWIEDPGARLASSSPTPSFVNPFKSTTKTKPKTKTKTMPTIEKDAAIPSKIEFASKVLPHPEKVSWGGEDALFVFGRSFGVFDGVSGADKLDGVPLYSVTLAKQMKRTVGLRGLDIPTLKSRLTDAAEYCDAGATGASTAVVGSIDDGFKLKVLNVGDSVLMVVRDGKMIARTKDILHYFDCPYQLGENSPDRPRDGTVLETQLKKGDVIIAASDGVFDNIPEERVCKIVEDVCERGLPGNILVKKIIDESRKVSLDPQAPTPYAVAAKRNRYEEYKSGVGGKVDDLSCVVVQCS